MGGGRDASSRITLQRRRRSLVIHLGAVISTLTWNEALGAASTSWAMADSTTGSSSSTSGAQTGKGVEARPQSTLSGTRCHRRSDG